MKSPFKIFPNPSSIFYCEVFKLVFKICFGMYSHSGQVGLIILLQICYLFNPLALFYFFRLQGLFFSYALQSDTIFPIL